MYKISKVIGYNCPNKYLLSKDGQPILFANGKKRLGLCMTYLEGYDVEIGDRKVERLLKKLRSDTNI